MSADPPNPTSSSSLPDQPSLPTTTPPPVKQEEQEEDPDQTTLDDASIAAEIQPTSTTQPTTMPPTNSTDPTNPAVLDPTVLEPPIPTKKDTTLRHFLSKTSDHAPLIPDAVTDYYLTLAGLPPPPETDRRLARLLALATQKFVADLAADAYQYSRIRSTNTTSNNPLTGLGGAAGFQEEGKKGGKEAAKAGPVGGPRAGFGGGGAAGGGGRTVLTMEDLGMAVGEFGVSVRRGEFYR